MSPVLLLAALVAALLAPAAYAAPVSAPKPAGVQTLKFKFGPIKIAPGDNTIKLEGNKQWPRVPGYIQRFKPDLKRSDGSVPRVDVVHLHHGVWVKGFQPHLRRG